MKKAGWCVYKVAPRYNKTRRFRRRVLIGGADQDRTDDLYNAIVALSQLSYGPIIILVSSALQFPSACPLQRGDI